METQQVCAAGHVFGGDKTVCPVCGTLPQSELWVPTAPTLPAIAGFEVRREVGRGGMGVVYQAWQASLNRLVALKMILDSTFAAKDQVDAFRWEAEALAQLQHPNFIHIYDVGTFQNKPFFTMEWVEGGNLMQRLSDLSTEKRVELVQILAQAMNVAHQQGIVHLDLKPLNVMLKQDGTPKIGDFGLARRFDANTIVQSGYIGGTIGYMSPEQAQGERRRIGPAADVYALGAILYELLTGQPPVMPGASLQVTLKRILEEDPVPPRQLAPAIPVDLETICLKCLQKSPADRYASAQALADDLQRFRKGEPISARPISSVELLWRWMKRRPAVAALMVLAPLVPMLVVIGLLLMSQRDEALKRRQLAEEHSQEADRLTREKDAALTDANLQRDRVQKYRYLSDMNLAERAWHDGNPEQMLALLGQHAARPGDRPRFEWNYLQRLGWSAFHSAPLQRSLDAASLLPGPIRAAVFSPDGHWLVCHTDPVRGDGAQQQARADEPWDQLTLWNIQKGEAAKLAEPEGVRKERAEIAGLAFSPDGKLLAAAVVFQVPPRETRGEVVLWNLDSKQVEARLEGKHFSIIRGISFGPDSRLLVSGDASGIVNLWNLADVRTSKTIDLKKLGKRDYNDSIECLAFAPDGKRLALCYDKKKLEVWSIDNGRSDPLRLDLLLEGMSDSVFALAFSPDGQLLACGGGGQWTRSGAGEVKHFGELMVFEATEDRRRAAPRGDLELDVRDAGIAIHTPILAVPGLTQRVRALAFDQDGRKLCSSGDDGMVRVWELSEQLRRMDREFPPRAKVLRGHADKVAALAFSPDGALVASGGKDRRLMVWDVTSEQDALSFGSKELAGARPDADPLSVVFSGDGTTLYSLVGFSVAAWDASTGLMRSPLRESRELAGLARQKDAALAAFRTLDKVKVKEKDKEKVKDQPFLTLWRPPSWPGAGGKPAFRLPIGQGGMGRLFFSPDGMRLATLAEQSRTLQLWNLAEAGPDVSPTLIISSDRKTPLILAAFQHDNERLATVSGEFGDELGLWDAASGKEVWTRRSPGLQSLSFSPAGILATGHGDGKIRIWKPQTGEVAQLLRGHRAAVKGLIFSANGDRLFSWSGDGSIQVRDTSTWEEVLTLQHRHRLDHAALSPDGLKLAAIGALAPIRIWDGSPFDVDKELKLRQDAFHQRRDSWNKTRR